MRSLGATPASAPNGKCFGTLKCAFASTDIEIIF